jgi:hypothetical protein
MDDDIQTRRYWTDFDAKVTGAPHLFGAATKKLRFSKRESLVPKLPKTFSK